MASKQIEKANVTIMPIRITRVMSSFAGSLSSDFMSKTGPVSLIESSIVSAEASSCLSFVKNE